MTQVNGTPPKWFLTSLAVWVALIGALPSVLAAFDLSLADKPVQQLIQVGGLVFTLLGVIFTSTGDKRSLLPSAKTPPDDAGPSVLGKLPIILLALFLLPLLGGCSNLTARQHDKLARLAYDGAVIGIAVADAAGKVSASARPAIAAAEERAQVALNASAQWLADNPQLADVPGIYPPTIDPLNVAIDVLRRYRLMYLLNLPLVPLTPNATPSTKPTAAPPPPMTIGLAGG